MKIKRIPRPLGLTLQLRSNKDLKEIKEYVINQWIQNNMYYNGEIYSINKMATYLSLPIEYIYKRSIHYMRKMSGVLNHMKVDEIARVLFSRAIFKGLEIQTLCEGQYRLLETSQGGTYKPFVSAEVNKSLKNLIDSTKPNLDLLKILTDKSPIANITISQEANTQGSLGPDEALRLINEASQSMLSDKSLIDPKMLSYTNLPDVNARTQDLRGIGIKHDGTPPNIPTMASNPDGPEIPNGPLTNPTIPSIELTSKPKMRSKVDSTDYELMDSDEFIS